MKKKYIKLLIIFFLYCNFLFFLNSYIIVNGIGNTICNKSQNIKTSSNSQTYWPTLDWIQSSPEAQGVNSEKLLEMDSYIHSGLRNFRIDSLLIIRNGYLIYESYPSTYYDEENLHHLFSVTKSFTSTLIGIAIDKGYIKGTDSLVLDFFPNRTIDNMDSRKQTIRIKDLLTMTAGFEWVDDINYYEMSSSDNWVQYVLNQPMAHSPGSRWNYNSGASHLLSAILDYATPNGTLAFAEEFLFEPLNITDYRWHLDSHGIPNGGTLLHLRPRDMAKLAYLYLMEGKWEDQQIVSREWIIQASNPAVLFSYNMEPLTGYGYLWWGLFWGKVYAARGSNQQNIFLIPDIDMIFVTTGNYHFDSISLLQNYILPATGYIILHPGIYFLSLIIAMTLLFLIPYYVNSRSLKKKLLRA